MKRFVLVALLTAILIGCGRPSAPTPTPDLQATEGAIRAELIATMTAEAPTPAPPPAPTETPTATSAATATALPATATPTAPPAKAYHWTRYDYNVEILANGDMLFTVDMGFSFDAGSFSQGYYSFDMDRLTDVQDIQVLEGSQPYSRVDSESTGGYRVSVDDQFQVLWWFPPTANATRDFTLTYRVVGGLRIYDAGDQFYWNFYAGDRSERIDSGVITVRLPDDVPLESLQMAVDPPDMPLVQIDARTLQAQVTNLEPNRVVLLRVQFPHGLIQAEPAPWQIAEDETPSPTPIPTLSSAAAALRPFVLQLADLPPGFSLFSEKDVTVPSAAAKGADPQATLAEYQAQGRGQSLFREYRKEVSLAQLLAGSIAIACQVTEYASAEGARRGLDYLLASRLAEGAEEISVSQLGDFSAGLRQTVSEDDWDWTLYEIMVQKGNLLSRIGTTTLAVAASIDEALELAGKATDRLH